MVKSTRKKRSVRRLTCEAIEARICLTAVAFASHEIVASEANGPRSVFATDIDGDGDLDVLSASRNDDKIAWHENTDGAGTFGSQRVITTQADGAQSVYAADVDGDGDVDVLSASYRDQKIAWYENIDGQGSFGAQQTITTDAVGANSIFAVDVDGDGDVDVVSLALTPQKNKIAWYENIDGQGAFGTQRVITTDANPMLSMYVADVDGDGDVDVLSASYRGNTVAWYENTDGAGTFGPQRGITTQAASSVSAVDVDGDGDMDVLSASYRGNTVAWYENIDGRGSFGAQRTITTERSGAGTVFAADVDGDGNVDVLSASGVRGNKIAWYESIGGKGDFGAPQVITTEAKTIASVYAADLDGDGDVDVLLASESEDKIAWTENTDGKGSFGPLHAITAPAASAAMSVHGADVDGDGDVDVLSASSDDDKIAWYENTDGAGTFGPQRVITTQADGAKSVSAVDVDGDGDLDVLSRSTAGVFQSSPTTIAWYENTDGAGTFGPKRMITTRSDHVASLSAADVDGDGDQDVLVAVASDDMIAWYENTGAGNFALLRLITMQTSNPRSVSAADVDGDGDVDVLSASQDDGKIAWYENTNGVGSFGPQRVITAQASGAQSVSAADVDGDGDVDVVSVSNDTIAWYENTDGAGTFGPLRAITTQAVNIESVSTADMDGDGDVDVLSASSYDDTIAWYENIDGMGDFGTQQVITTEVSRARSVFAADIDGDGDVDALSASKYDDKIAWYENRVVGDSNNDGVFDSSDFVAVLAAGKYEDGIPNNATFDEGDWNQDGDFTASDFVFALQAGSYDDGGAPLASEMAAAFDWLQLQGDQAKKGRAFVA